MPRTPKTHPCVMEPRVEALEAQVTEIRTGQAEILTAVADVRTQGMLTHQAIAGNGVKGLAERMSYQETATAKLSENAITPEKVAEIAKATVHAVINNARTRDKTFIAKVAALSPVALPVALILIYIMANVFHWTIIPNMTGMTP